MARRLVEPRQRLEDAAQFYLRWCYRRQTAARAEEFAQHVHVARPYLSRHVRCVTGMSVRSFLRSRQLVYAKRLLESTPLSVDQVGRAAGFGTGWTFHRYFKQQVGITPGEYRLAHSAV